jgi:hypothetical protein
MDINYFHKSNNQDKTVASNLGKKWTEEEDSLLLTELDNNIDINTIANKHNRSKNGIICRQKEIAYKMSIKNISMIEIINKTKLDEITINEFIKKKSIKKNKIEDKNFSIEDEINEIKNDIKELKNTLKEVFDMMKAVYEFEDS